jgi:hypothetical protein
MAKVANPLIGKTSGSIGGVTFSSWKGVNVAKSKPTVVANPQSDAQVAQRAAFSLLVSLYRAMVSILVIGFKELAIKKSEFNAFVSQNLKNAFDLSSPPTATFVPASFMISKGTITDTPITSVVADVSDGDITFTYPTTATAPGQSATDKPVMAVYNATKEEWTNGVGTATRADGTDTLAIPATWEDADVIHSYLGFVNAAGDAASDSVYLLGAVVA